jgi:hypothetical protein
VKGWLTHLGYYLDAFIWDWWWELGEEGEKRSGGEFWWAEGGFVIFQAAKAKRRAEGGHVRQATGCLGRARGQVQR